MKIIKSIFLIAITTVIFTSCTDDSDSTTVPVVANVALNIYAPVETDYTVNPPTEAGEFTKFSFSEGATVTGENWDIAFRGTSILVNGGTAIGLTDEPTRTGEAAISVETGTFASILEASADTTFSQDAEGTYALTKGSGNGWYSYNSQTHIISPIAGKIIVVKTHDGHYAKMEILSYYKDQDSSLDSGYYSFNFVYNPNADDKSLE